MSKERKAFRGARDSETGRFVTEEYADRHPDKTQKENIPLPGHGDTGRYGDEKE